MKVSELNFAHHIGQPVEIIPTVHILLTPQKEFLSMLCVLYNVGYYFLIIFRMLFISVVLRGSYVTHSHCLKSVWKRENLNECLLRPKLVQKCFQHSILTACRNKQREIRLAVGWVCDILRIFNSIFKILYCISFNGNAPIYANVEICHCLASLRLRSTHVWLST